MRGPTTPRFLPAGSRCPPLHTDWTNHAALDVERLGLAQVAFVQVTLSGTTAPQLEAFNHAVREAPEIEACHMIAGGFDYLLKIRTRDVAAYRRALTDLMLTHGEIALMGEDVGRKGGVYGVTQKLMSRFGPSRVIDTLLDEQSILGLREFPNLLHAVFQLWRSD